MNLQAPLALCAAVHTGALMFWFGTLALRRMPGLAPAAVAEASGPQVAGVLALASGALWPVLQTGVALDDAKAALDPVQLALVIGQTSFGRIWIAREVVVAGALVLAYRMPWSFGAPVLLLVGGALASMALLGHAAGVGGSLGYGQRAVLALHLLAAGAWVGALPWLWRAARNLPSALLASVLRRFSAIGIALVAIVVLTGGLSAWWRTGNLEALLYSSYSRVLLGKIGLVLLMGVAALLNRNRFTPALERTQMAGPQATAEPARRRLVASIGTETTLAVAVVLLAFFLGAAEAPR